MFTYFSPEVLWIEFPSINTTVYVGVTFFALCGPVGVLVGFEATRSFGIFDRGHEPPIFNCSLPDLLLPNLPTGFMWSLRLRERHRFSTRPFVLHFIYDCYLQHWTHQISFTRFGRKFVVQFCDIFSTPP